MSIDNEMYRQIVEAVPEGIWVVDVNSPQIRGFIRKPFQFGDLLKALRSSLSM